MDSTKAFLATGFENFTIVNVKPQELRKIHHQMRKRYGIHCSTDIETNLENKTDNQWFIDNVIETRHPFEPYYNKNFIYIIVSDDNKYAYVGLSCNPFCRLDEHNYGLGTPGTTGKTWYLVALFLASSRNAAKEYEKQMVSNKGNWKWIIHCCTGIDITNIKLVNCHYTKRKGQTENFELKQINVLDIK